MEGRDLLLVMPTGSGKSLCYQLPAVALGGTALVISPLIALMEDQAAKLSALGLRVARVHSGLERAVARQACIDYLSGSLQFLFIAPERLRVPGFGEMLAKRKPSLIAIDEAHCISQWGHDFRPDYRMLGSYIPGLRPAPVLALTATATAAVQDDIVTQLGMENPARFIRGFRRDNLAIEVVEVPIPARAEAICGLLANPAHRPAIVYATSRKTAESLAAELARVAPAAAYHAGLDQPTRDDVQTRFLAGELEIVVATIAFGMGIDKADIRTVIHAGLPATLEGYYQEIGRAGRDGKPSRTLLMHSYADQRTHGFFLQRDYPPSANLEQIYRKLDEAPQPVEALRAEVKLADEEFDKALEKLEIHGGAHVDFGGNVTRGGPIWRKTYKVQAQFRAEQFQQVLHFVASSECRMGALIRHFGDVADAYRPCGLCDVCDPAGAVMRQFRHASVAERGIAQNILDELRAVDYKATGSLQRDLGLTERLSRDQWESLLASLERARLISIEEAEYEKDGEVRRFRKVRITDDGLDIKPTTPIELLVDDGLVGAFSSHRLENPKTKKKSSGKLDKLEAQVASRPLTDEEEELVVRIKQWRLGEAKQLGIPAYMVLNDRTITALAQTKPRSPNELESVNGIGPAKAERFGQTILGLIAAES
jgi:RecQ family ATP-dependent DNA helicase